MNKKYIIISLVIIVVIFLLFGGRSADKTAKQAIEALFSNDASKFISLMSNEAIEAQLDDLGIETKKLLKNHYKKVFEETQKKAKDKYGKKWKYDIEIIDSYDYSASTEEIEKYGSSNFKEVAYEISHKGSGLFNDKEGKESGKILVAKKGLKWYLVKLK